jgi:outer membrane protein TolC
MVGPRAEPLALHQRSAPPATQPLAQGPLDLDRAIRIALRNNPELHARGAEADQAQAAKDVAAGAQWPRIDAIGGYTHFLDPQRVIPPHFNNEPGAFSRDALGADLVLSLPLYTGGQITNRVRAAEFLRAAAAGRVVRNRDELVFNVTSLYYAVLSQGHIISSLEFSQKTLEQHRDRIQELIENQKAVKVDLLRTQVRLADLEQRLVQERNVLAIQKQVLANQLGISKPGHEGLDVVGELPRDVAPATAPVNTSDVLAQRADYQAALAEVRALERNVVVAKGALWPQIYAQAAYGLRYGIDADRPAGVGEGDDVAALGVLVDIPIFEGGQLRAKVRQERAGLMAALDRLHKLELQIDLDVSTAQSNISSSRQRVAATAQSIEEAQESYDIERQKYDASKGTIVDVLDAQSALLDVQTNYYRALADYQTALAQLQLALGRTMP